jgi:hypothetical protein
MVFFEAGLPVVTAEEFDFSSFTKIDSLAQVATLKDKLEWTKDDFAKFQDQIRSEITSLTASAA